ncbi:hypothetical protein AJ79_07640 [Helicocarpus griseus UAMH5409]|uniref:Uncharacterized protein n=1 Tax=Helicocarpus griseus UAMH5409 TaxID=1447875 RepID=A0A2B7X149_9EURO|nr:hypothetical protein AJ79_07640 [Helicocarpus griseus UAMH5409]
MWNCSDSEPDENDTMVRRCSYCGRFGGAKSLVEETGLCHKCHENIHPSAKGNATFVKAGNDGPSSVAATVLSKMAAVEVNDDSSSMGSITSIHPDREDDDEENENGDNGDGSKDKKTNGWKLQGKSSNNSSNTEEGDDLCARCWKNQSTTILYNTPICDDCYQIAQEKREHTKGTKKRFQPPTPNLQPGKRLTRVCDSCRQKRKRCQHRRVVDENDPEADFRRKRSRKKQPSLAPTRSREGRSSTSSSSVIEVNDTVIVSETEQEPVAAAPPATAPTATSTGTTLNGGTTARSTAPHRAAVAESSEGYSTDNLRRAIEGSVHVVFSREMEKLVATAEGKLEDAAAALDDVKEHMKMWLGRLRDGM